MIVQPKIRGFICTTAHPKGCEASVLKQIEHVKSKGNNDKSIKNALIIGSSTGYGLASRIALAYGSGANTLGLCFEKEGADNKTGTAGFYNSAALAKQLKADGLYGKTLNGDAFSNEMKTEVVELIKKEMGPIDMVVYSLASPVRKHPETGELHRSTLKPINQTFSDKTIDTNKGLVKDITVEPATQEDIDNTVTVMGGDDWQRWIDALKDADLLAENVQTVAYSYIGPEITFPIYRHGTIGQAKEDLESTAHKLTKDTLSELSGKAYVSVNKALVTQASSAIPVVPLYIAILYKIMKEKGTHEGCIEQMQRLFQTHLCSDKGPKLDEAGRIRVDDWEMENDVQAEVQKVWEIISTENVYEVSDLKGYQKDFLSLFGFGFEGVNYDEDVETNIPLNP